MEEKSSENMDFSRIAQEYDNRAIIQGSAGKKLLALLDIKAQDDVLDLGCGTGTLTMRIKDRTSGRVVGIDAEEEMILKAREKYDDRGIIFECIPAEEMTFEEKFDVVFCNSVFQWFQLPEQVLRRCFEALRPGGRVGVQAPARKVYCPNFLEAIEAVKQAPDTGETFKHFREPWFFLETEQQYKTLFEKAGFRILYVEIKQTLTEHTPEEVYRIFDSGASAGYLNQGYYDVEIDETYIARFRQIVMGSFQKQAVEGIVRLVFNRIYVIGVKM